jgi:hypothetical protein
MVFVLSLYEVILLYGKAWSCPEVRCGNEVQILGQFAWAYFFTLKSIRMKNMARLCEALATLVMALAFLIAVCKAI